MLPQTVSEILAECFGAATAIARVSGGDVSAAARVEAGGTQLFVKWNAGPGGHSFGAEAAGLALLVSVAPEDIVVPKPLLASIPDGATPGVLVLPWLERGRPTDADWRRFGAALAELHRADAPGDGAFGAAADNWIGSKPQRNGWSDSWPAFFGQKRLSAQAGEVRRRGAWNGAWDGPLDRLIERLPELLPEAPHPSVLHGDLWAGNALPTTNGRFALIDPATYVGHREADLAMTELFGGFAPAFYDGYRDAWPLDPGYAERREIYNLFHLINHLTHGPGYAGSVAATLQRFGR